MLLVYNSFAKQRYMELWFLMFCKTMIFVNSAINPILYNALSVKFRRAFKKMLCCEPTNHYQCPQRTVTAPPTSVFKRNETVSMSVTVAHTDLEVGPSVVTSAGPHRDLELDADDVNEVNV